MSAIPVRCQQLGRLESAGFSQAPLCGYPTCRTSCLARFHHLRRKFVTMRLRPRSAGRPATGRCHEHPVPRACTFRGVTDKRLAPGDPAPDFTLDDADGNPVTLSSLRGQRVIVYFYPAAMTPGWTKQACDFRDS